MEKIENIQNVEKFQPKEISQSNMLTNLPAGMHPKKNQFKVIH